MSSVGDASSVFSGRQVVMTGMVDGKGVEIGSPLQSLLANNEMLKSLAPEVATMADWCGWKLTQTPKGIEYANLGVSEHALFE